MHQRLNLPVNGGFFKMNIMHPVDKKNKILLIIIAVFAIPLTLIAIIRNPFNLMVLVVLAILAFANSINTKHSIILLGILTVTGFSMILAMDYYLVSHGYSDIENGSFKHFLLIMFFLVPGFIPLMLVHLYFYDVLKVSASQKEYFDLINKSPYLVCMDHFTRTKERSALMFKTVRCRHGKKCLDNDRITHAVNLVGLIGKIENGKQTGADYYVTLWDHRVNKIRYGDYDVIEIHYTKDISNYDFVINKVFTFFDNEIDRYKPLGDVVVKIFGKVPITENTKKILENHFLKVEYHN